MNSLPKSLVTSLIPISQTSLRSSLAPEEVGYHLQQRSPWPFIYYQSNAIEYENTRIAAAAQLISTEEQRKIGFQP